MVSSQVQEEVRYNRALQAVRRSCLLTGSRAGPAEGPGLATGEGREALAELCAASRAAPPHAKGSILNAYRRWTKGEIRKLTDPTHSASRAGS